MDHRTNPPPRRSFPQSGMEADTTCGGTNGFAHRRIPERGLENPCFSSLLITRTREANTFVLKHISCREEPRERPPATAYDIARSR
jgi:hypothetical protein